ncbi:uncharacterized protein FA14DRAFT_119093 [Meira miltonrushii]|uniref:Chromatin-remodeling ATPase INO80 n=1 Tax=Meira miltonrushii TaxID=1280837 RepID=A0A316VH75_9BASI|nr:uncharacterized protein FA14DRAFT_119093 [Meira miltonrushii]PWN36896.1 hypothetical protein FA14DRAFT_119093 [Meira miltonrushii]
MRKAEVDWDSDLESEENRPYWTGEIEIYASQWDDRLACIEESYETNLLEKEKQIGKRLSRGYRTRYEPVLARVKAREDHERRQRELRHEKRRDFSRKQREREVDLELLGTLDDGDHRNKAYRQKGKAGRYSGFRALADEEEDDLLNELLGSSDDEMSYSRMSKKRRYDHGFSQAAEDLESMLDSRASSPASAIVEDVSLQPGGPMTERRENALIDAHKKIWTSIARRDVPKVYRIVQAGVTNKAMYWRRLSGVVAREAKRGASRGNKTAKDQQQRARKVMREMLVYWRKNEKEERELRKKAEKEALEKAKKEEEMREAKRQARKLNFLITQTELYSHFVGNKLKTSEAEESEETSGGNKAISSTPAPGADPTVPPIAGDNAAELADAEARLAELKDLDFDDEDEANLRAHARKNAEEAVAAAKAKATAFDQRAAEERKKLAEEQGEGRRIDEKDLGKAFDQDDLNFLNPSSMGQMDLKQPKMLTCQLKEYQLKGLNWLANLYEQGINGILADEMGLGKTVQSISLMAYLAEVHDIWGPFLVIAPASTLHNWQQEISRFVPNLKALPYWGNVKDRTVLRKFWNRKQVSYHRDAPFHVLITSYQLVVSDEKYFQRVKWQYMVLDEAQAIKSSSSNRWKTLLGFDCRNRLLLTGTPVQNSMQELWALLHFIMPSLFDSHDEFSEWFSKDIESHAENKGTLNEHQLRRLHMILKPFMLRRIKKNVQNELGDKIEIDVFCDMSARQRYLYRNLRSRVSIAELMDKAQSNDDAGLKSLMNLVMQFRKVVGHPELFERADVEAPLAFTQFAQSGSLAREGDLLSCGDSTRSFIEYELPKLVCRQGGLLNVPGPHSRAGFDTHYLGNLMNVYRSANVHQSSNFSFLPLLNLTASDVEKSVHGNPSSRIMKEMVAEAEKHTRSPYLYDDDFAASSVRAFGDLTKPIPTNSGAAPSMLVPLDGIAEDYNKSSFLSSRDARPLITPVVAPPAKLICSDGPLTQHQEGLAHDDDVSMMLYGLAPSERESEPALLEARERLPSLPPNGLLAQSGDHQLPGSEMRVPQMDKLITDSSKMAKLDELLRELKAGGHRVLIYFQMTRMMDLMEEYLIYRQHKYLRLDGSTRIDERRDAVTDWQTRPELFVFLLSTRAGGLGINLTAADTVIFYDHDWNPSNDQQAMDRAHRLGQTKQVTIYRLITKNTIDERIVRLARNKKEVQDIVVGNKAYSEQGMAKPQEIVNLLLDDDQMAETMLRRKQEEERVQTEGKAAQMKSNVAKRKAKAEAAAVASPQIQGQPTWAFDEDEDDFFGAKVPPRNKITEISGADTPSRDGRSTPKNGNGGASSAKKEKKKPGPKKAKTAANGEGTPAKKKGKKSTLAGQQQDDGFGDPEDMNIDQMMAEAM